MPKKVFEGTLNFEKFKDSGRALITDFDVETIRQGGIETSGCIDAEDGLFIRIQSWVEEIYDFHQDRSNDINLDKNLFIDKHAEIKPFLNRTVRVTIETLYDD